MTPSDRRSTERMNSLNFLDYVVLGEEGGRGLARTLNLSESGLLLETYRPLKVGQELLLTLGLKEELFQLRGRVAHGAASGEGRYASGILFLEMEEKDRDVLRRFMEFFTASQA